MYILKLFASITVSIGLFWLESYLDHWNGATPRWRGGYWLSRVLVTSEMDSKGLPVSGLESGGQLGPFPPLMIPPRVGAEGGGAEGGTRRCCCWCCCPARCPCRLLSPLFPQLTGACCNRNRAFPRYFDHPYFQPLAFHLTRHVYIYIFHIEWSQYDLSVEKYSPSTFHDLLIWIKILLYLCSELKSNYIREINKIKNENVDMQRLNMIE